MGLQIWLPLNGNLNNQGLSNATVTVNGTTDFAMGKIGQGLSCNGSSYWTITPVSLNNTASICCWAKTNVSGKMLWVIVANSSNVLNLYSSSIYTLNTGDGNNNPFKDNNGNNISILTDNIWHHFAVTFSDTEVKLYIDGIYRGIAQTYKSPATTSTNTIRLGGGFNEKHVYDWDGMINDFRIYDHALSEKEVEEIAKGLILHYKLDEQYLSSTNLLRNGFGELGTVNWGTPSRVTTTDLPSGHSEIKAKVLNNTSIDYTPIARNSTYEVSAYVKASTTSGSTYFCLIPYDIDKKRINHWNAAIGFNLATMTVLTQDLKSGDTKIYVNDLSQWNANSGHYYNYAAIFYYMDSTGYLYPPGSYTQITPAFGSGTNAKTNLDKTNNIITLNSAYSGITIPAGTSVCASTAGATYFYPFGSITNSTISDWTYKTATFSTEGTYLSAAYYVQVYTYSNGYYAGMSIKNLSINPDNIIYDSSGYSNNGIVTGSFSINNNTSRYSQNIYIENGATSYITTPSLNFYNGAITLNIWFKSTNTSPTGNYHMIVDSIEDRRWYEMCMSNTGFFRAGLFVNGARKADNCTSTTGLNGDWHMLTLTYDGTAVKRYYDATMEKSTSVAIDTGLSSPTALRIGRNGPNADYTCNEVELSDFRIYSSALTDDQIKDLYSTSVTIDKNGNIHARELVEV